MDCSLPTTLLRPWDFPGRSTGVGCHFLLQRIFPTQGSNLGLPSYRQTLYRLSHEGSPNIISRFCQLERTLDPADCTLGISGLITCKAAGQGFPSMGREGVWGCSWSTEVSLIWKEMSRWVDVSDCLQLGCCWSWVVSDSVTPGTVAHEASLPFTISWSLLKLMCTESVMPSNHLILCHSLLLLPSIFPSIGIFSSESALRYQVAKVLEFQFQHQSFQRILEVIAFRIDWLNLTVQGTHKSLLQHHISKAPNLQCSAILWSNSHICTWLLEKPSLWLDRLLSAKWCLCFLVSCLRLS